MLLVMIFPGRFELEPALCIFALKVLKFDDNSRQKCMVVILNLHQFRDFIFLVFIAKLLI